MSAINAMSAAQKQELETAIQFIKTCDYKGTHVKVELEAQLNRPYDEDDSTYCRQCDGDGYLTCGLCDDGSVDHDHDPDVCQADCDLDYEDCADCGGMNRTDCDDCEGSGELDRSDSDWGFERCGQYLRDHVPAAAREALVFDRFYNDGSVDSEYTFTIPIDKVHMVVYFIEAFKALAEAIGEGLGTSGAGMHIAILNSETGNYPRGNSINYTKGRNFAQALQPLLPALYFLASAGYESRGLQYRPPRILLDDKYAAISGSHDCFEYRIFETCYERPLAFVDFMIVIAKTLQFYKDEPTNTSLKLGELGVKDGRGIERFYYTTKHLEALDKGLKLLKPDYKTIDELKLERNFKLNRAMLRQQEQSRVTEWHEEFKQVKTRRRYERMKLYYKGVAEAYNRLSNGSSDVDVKAFAREYVKNYATNYGYVLKGSARDYIQLKHKNYLTDNVGYTVTV